MQHPNFETRHPLQSEDHQETGFDALQSFNKNENSMKEWDDLFLNSNYLARIRQAGINGRLRSSRFRSVCWKLYLEVLPEDKEQWINKTKELRGQYEKIKEMVRAPICGHLWNKFFQDKELKGMVKQDVLRTFPEIRYFQDEDVRTKLTDILFCYARENEQLLYKQGMHELLAPIVFVLHCDHQAFQHASETASPSEEMKCLLDPVYLEHDAYAMFSQLMETAEPWFSSFEREVRKGKEEMLTTIPFARPQDAGPSVAIVTKVNRIQDQLVKKHDIELHMHLNRLEIAPQIYGMSVFTSLGTKHKLLPDFYFYFFKIPLKSVFLFLVIASNFQTCLGLLMHYPPIGDINSLLQKALFLRDPKNNPRPVNYHFQQNLDYYKTKGADLMNKTRSGSTKAAPLNINKVSSSLLNFGRKLIAPAMSGASISPINSEVHSSSSSSSSTSPASAPTPISPHPLADPSAPTQTQGQAQTQHYRLLKSESMPVHLSKGQSSRTVSSSTSIESLSGGRGQSTASPPLPPSRGSDVSTSSPPLSATKKESFFNITRSRSHSKTMGKKEMEEDLEAQVSFLQGQINDLEAMSKYCAKMMNTHICKIQEVILQEHIEKEDEVLVSLAGLKQIKDILKGALRFNQSQLEAEENEEITIADDHYTSTAAVASSLGLEGKNWDDYILISQDGDLHAETGGKSASERTPPIRRGRGMVRMEPEGAAGTFQDPLMAGTTSGSSSPDEGSTHSKDSDFTIVNPNDL
uniref:TBC1 domain family, member 5 n=1 Tax=Haplochromis burtoni TaxID=8153 RepID=A0A3Q2VV03_HAPBU